ncbi:MAG: hypothetical protein P4L20_19640 [Acidimicrobiales bacterium]|nr:hypothetical protein [Acidimicrobiales bacterium]
MNEIERRTGTQGGAYVGGKWFSADELRAAGRRVTDGLLRGDVGICPACGASRLGATGGPGSLEFAPGSECLNCGHIAGADDRPNVDNAERPNPELRSAPYPAGIEDASSRILDTEVGNGESVEALDNEDT